MANFLGKLFGFDAEKHKVRTEIVAGKFKKISPTMWVLAALFICKYIFI